MGNFVTDLKDLRANWRDTRGPCVWRMLSIEISWGPWRRRANFMRNWWKLVKTGDQASNLVSPTCSDKATCTTGRSYSWNSCTFRSICCIHPFPSGPVFGGQALWMSGQKCTCYSLHPCTCFRQSLIPTIACRNGAVYRLNRHDFSCTRSLLSLTGPVYPLPLTFSTHLHQHSLADHWSQVHFKKTIEELWQVRRLDV